MRSTSSASAMRTSVASVTFCRPRSTRPSILGSMSIRRATSTCVQGRARRSRRISAPTNARIGSMPASCMVWRASASASLSGEGAAALHNKWIGGSRSASQPWWVHRGFSLFTVETGIETGHADRLGLTFDCVWKRAAMACGAMGGMNSQRRDRARPDAHVPSCGNVSADLRLPAPEAHLAKSMLAAALQRRIRDRGLTRRTAAAAMAIPQPELTKILRGRFVGISEDAIAERLARLA